MSADQSFAVATHALVMLAFSSPQIVSAKQIADELSLNPAVVRRTMTRLVKADIVRSVAGPQGGYLLVDAAVKLSTVFSLLHSDDGVASSRFEVPVSNCAEGLAVDRIVGEIYQSVDVEALRVFESWTVNDIKQLAIERLTE